MTTINDHAQRMREATIRGEGQTKVFEYPMDAPDESFDVFFYNGTGDWRFRSNGAFVGWAMDEEIQAEIVRRNFERVRTADLESAAAGVER